MSYTFLAPIDPIDIALRWSAGFNAPAPHANRSLSNVTPLEWGSGSLGTSGQLLDAAENSKVCNMMVVSDKIRNDTQSTC